MEPKIKGKAFNYNDTRDRKFYDVFVWMFHPLAKIVFKTQYIGRENVPKTGSLIIASNHRNSRSRSHCRGESPQDPLHGEARAVQSQ